MKSPKLDTKVVEPLTDDQLKALIKTCTGKELRDRRDEALVRFMAETGARAGEAAVIGLDDVDLPNGVAIVRRGKGGKGRTVPFGPQTALAIDRYLPAAASRPPARRVLPDPLAHFARLALKSAPLGISYYVDVPCIHNCNQYPA